jgi:hypothetical protein
MYTEAELQGLQIAAYGIRNSLLRKYSAADYKRLYAQNATLARIEADRAEAFAAEAAYLAAKVELAA